MPNESRAPEGRRQILDPSEGGRRPSGALGLLGNRHLGLAPQATYRGSFGAPILRPIERTESSGVSPFSHPTAESAKTGFAGSPRAVFIVPPVFCHLDGRLAIPPVFFSFPSVRLSWTATFPASRAPIFLGRPFFSVPGHHLSSPSGILASRTAIFESGAPSFFRSRYLSSRAVIRVTRAAGFWVEPPSGFRSAHPSLGSLIRAFEAVSFVPARCASRQIQEEGAMRPQCTLKLRRRRDFMSGIQETVRIKA